MPSCLYIQKIYAHICLEIELMNINAYEKYFTMSSSTTSHLNILYDSC